MAWFEEKKQKRERAPVLRVSARRRTKVKGRYAHIAGLAAVPVAAILGTFLLWLSIRELGALLYARSDAFTIRDLRVLATNPRTKTLVKDYTQIKEGQNIFGFDSEAVRSYVLANSPNFQSMTITRYLPDRVDIEVIDRTPLVRIGQRGDLVADGEGCVFVSRMGARGLPEVTGYNTKGLKPGMQLEGPIVAALQLVEACGSPRLEMRPFSVDVGDPEKLVLKMEYGDKNREVPITWNGMGRRSSGSRKRLAETLAFVKAAFDDPKGARLSFLDATIEGRLYGR